MRRFLPAVVLLAIVGATVVSARFLLSWLTGGDAIPVKAVQVRRISLPLEVRGIGELRPVREVNIVAGISGLLEEVRYKVGDSVAAGQVVASLRVTELIRQLRETETRIKSAQADLQEKQTRLGELEKGLERTRELRNRDLIAGQDLSAAEAAVATGRAQAELAGAQVAEQQAILKQLRYLLGYSKVVAPFGGVVTQRVGEPGTYVQRSEPILTLASPDVLRVTVKMSETDLNLIHVGMPAQIKAEAYPKRIFQGTVVELRSGTGTTVSDSAVEIHMTNDERLLNIGTDVSVFLATTAKRDVLVVPQRAVTETAGKQLVDIVTTGKVQPRMITVAGNYGEMVEVSSGVREGEWVVVSSQHRLTADMRVRMVVEKTSVD